MTVGLPEQGQKLRLPHIESGGDVFYMTAHSQSYNVEQSGAWLE
jgi:hypothetical protein